ncbi:MAG: hypothetical protein AAFQ41_14805 [Cyanobacteria bacterium J06623_7]
MHSISAGVTGIRKGIDAVSDNSQAKQLQEDARIAYEITERDLKYFDEIRLNL